MALDRRGYRRSSHCECDDRMDKLMFRSGSCDRDQLRPRVSIVSIKQSDLVEEVCAGSGIISDLSRWSTE
jgi:hypothetical protein